MYADDLGNLEIMIRNPMPIDAIIDCCTDIMLGNKWLNTECMENIIIPKQTTVPINMMFRMPSKAGEITASVVVASKTGDPYYAQRKSIITIIEPLHDAARFCVAGTYDDRMPLLGLDNRSLSYLWTGSAPPWGKNVLLLVAAPKYYRGNKYWCVQDPTSNPPYFDIYNFFLDQNKMESLVRSHPGHIYQIMNEPDLPPYVPPGSPDPGLPALTPQEYAELIDKAYRLLKAWDGGCKIAIGSVSHLGLDWLKEVFNYKPESGFDLKSMIDIFTFHVYANDLAGFKNKVNQFVDYFHSIDSTKPIWLTEYGWAVPFAYSDPAQDEAEIRAQAGRLLYFSHWLATERPVDRWFWFYYKTWGDPPRYPYSALMNGSPNRLGKNYKLCSQGQWDQWYDLWYFDQAWNSAPVLTIPRGSSVDIRVAWNFVGIHEDHVGVEFRLGNNGQYYNDIGYGRYAEVSPKFPITDRLETHRKDDLTISIPSSFPTGTYDVWLFLWVDEPYNMIGTDLKLSSKVVIT